MLSQFAEELKTAREKANLSQQQLAAKIRIDLKFLKAMEEGNFSFLPEIYVNAFVREYARVVGLDEKRTFNRFQLAKQGKLVAEVEEDIERPVSFLESKTTSAKKSKAIRLDQEQSKISDESTPEQPKQPAPEKKKLNPVYFIAAGGVVIITLISYFLFFNKGPEIVVKEKPFEQLVEDSKQRYEEEKPVTDVPVDTIASQTNTQSANQQDSLILVFKAFDTSWIRVIKDDKIVEEFLLAPNTQKSVKAKSNYKITLGNSGGVQISLNNKQIGFNGKPGKVVHLSLSSAGIEYLSSPPNIQSE
ncbi:MAG: helix-turn-helix domain-containing protein [Ignavibacteriaceae bacterium]|nr:helix-turn-helix domain-containing protein [Ignavibacteriaceae bacterium]